MICWFLCTVCGATEIGVASAPANGTNMIFVKVPKCASSTASGVARRVAMRFGLYGVQEDLVESDWRHLSVREPLVLANHLYLRNMERDLLWNLTKPVFPLWTMLREPSAQAMSAFYYFEVRKKGEAPSLEAKLAYLNESIAKATWNFVPSWVLPSRCRHDRARLVECVFETYHFVGVAEYFDESMVLLAEVAQVPLSSVLYLASKKNTIQTDRHGLESYFEHDYVAARAFDYRLWEAATARVRAAFQNEDRQRKLESYRRMLALVRAECASPHDLSICYWNDNGCGYACIDRLFGP